MPLYQFEIQGSRAQWLTVQRTIEADTQEDAEKELKELAYQGELDEQMEWETDQSEWQIQGCVVEDDE